MYHINVTELEAFCGEQRRLGDHSLRAYRVGLQAFQTFVALPSETAGINRDTILG